jgi:hypothetical protein
MATTLQTIREVLVRGRTEGMEQVKADLQGVATAQAAVASSGVQMANVTDMASKRTLSVADAMERHRRSLDATYRAQLQYDRVQRDINAGIAAGIPGLERLSALNQQRYTQSLGNLAGVGKAAEMSTGNIANMTYQLNDVAVSLASGQSPFTVLMQQGMQLGQIFGPGSTLRTAAGAIGTAFMSMLNPINLAVVGLAAAAGGASLLYGYITDEGPKAEDTLKKHADLIRSFKDAYGDAADGLRDYTAASQSVLSTQIRAGMFETQARFDALVPTTLGELGMRSQGRFSPNSPFTVFREEIEAAGKLALEGKPAFIALYDAVSGRANREPGNKALTEIALQLFDIIAGARAAEAQLKSLMDAQRVAEPTDTRREAILDRYQSQRSGNTAAGFGIPIPRSSPLRSLAENPFAAEIAAARQLREEMVLELREAAIESMDDIRQAANGVLSGFLSDIRQGTDLWTAFGNAANRVMDSLFDRISQNLTDSLFGVRGSTSTGLIGSMLGMGMPTLPVGSAANSNTAAGPAPGHRWVGPEFPASAIGMGGGGAAPSYYAPQSPAGLYGPPLPPADPSRFDGAFGQFGKYQFPNRFDNAFNQFTPSGEYTAGGQPGFINAPPVWTTNGFDPMRSPAGSMGAPPVFPGAPAFGDGMAQAAQAAQTANQSFTGLSSTLQATTPQVGGLGQAIASIISTPAGGGGGIGGFFASLFGGGGGDPLLSAGVYHSGGTAGSPSQRRRVPSSMFANDEVPAILQRGERVVPAGQNDNGGGRTSVNVYNSSGEKAEVQERQTDFGKVIDVYVGRSIAKGTHDKAIGSRFGLEPKKTRRA